MIETPRLSKPVIDRLLAVFALGAGFALPACSGYDPATAAGADENAAGPDGECRFGGTVCGLPAQMGMQYLNCHPLVLVSLAVAIACGGTGQDRKAHGIGLDKKLEAALVAIFTISRQ